MKKVEFGGTQAPVYEPLSFRCEVCGGLACAGEGVALLKGERGRWWCSAHLPERLRRPPVEAEPVAEAPQAAAPPPPAERGLRPSPIGKGQPGPPQDRRQRTLL